MKEQSTLSKLLWSILDVFSLAVFVLGDQRCSRIGWLLILLLFLIVFLHITWCLRPHLCGVVQMMANTLLSSCVYGVHSLARGNMRVHGTIKVHGLLFMFLFSSPLASIMAITREWLSKKTHTVSTPLIWRYSKSTGTRIRCKTFNLSNLRHFLEYLMLIINDIYIFFKISSTLNQTL